MLRSFLVAMVLAVSIPVVAQQVRPSQPSAQERLASVTDSLGQCQSDLGPLTRLSARVIAGQVFDAAGAKARLEAANPELTLDPETFKIGLKGDK